jgi:hypothetical protein
MIEAFATSQRVSHDVSMVTPSLRTVPVAPQKEALERVIGLARALMFPEYCEAPTSCFLGASAAFTAVSKPGMIPPPTTSSKPTCGPGAALVRTLPTVDETMASAKLMCDVLGQQILAAALLNHWEARRQVVFQQRAAAALGHFDPIQEELGLPRMPLGAKRIEPMAKMSNHGAAHGGRVIEVVEGRNTIPGSDGAAPDVDALRYEIETLILLPLVQRLPKIAVNLESRFTT